jgi:hypothetical protein
MTADVHVGAEDSISAAVAQIGLIAAPAEPQVQLCDQLAGRSPPPTKLAACLTLVVAADVRVDAGIRFRETPSV